MEFLIIVDAQNDFITGKLAAPGAEEVVKNICHELKQTSAFPIVTQDIHDQREYALSVEGKNLPEHCDRNSTGCWLHDELFNVLKCKVGCEYYAVRKSTFAYMNWPTIFSEILQFFPIQTSEQVLPPSPASPSWAFAPTSASYQTPSSCVASSPTSPSASRWTAALAPRPNSTKLRSKSWRRI